MNLIEKARAFAAEAHKGQLRKYTGEPYITHPEAVAAIVAGVTDSEAAIAAALLHDVVEDCGVTLEQIAAMFGGYVAYLVDGLTNDMPQYSLKLEVFGPVVQTIKLADIIDNTATIVERDPVRAVGYLIKKAAMLRAITRGDPNLYRHAWTQVNDGLRALGL